MDPLAIAFPFTSPWKISFGAENNMLKCYSLMWFNSKPTDALEGEPSNNQIVQSNV